jgi:DNA-binding MarR family transcriptional regulator
MAVSTYVEFWAQDLAYLLYDCSRLLRRRFDERIRDFSLRDAQWRVIVLLSHSEGLKQTQLAALLGIQKVPLGEHLDKLEAGGWVERRRNKSDRRANYVYINSDVKSHVEKIDQRFLELSESIGREMGADDWQTLQLNLKKLFVGFAVKESQQALSHVKFSSNLYLIGVLSRQLGKQFDSSLKRLGTTRSHWLILSVLVRQPGICQSELAKLVDMTKAPLGKIIEQLVDKQWLVRKIDSRDKRQKRLTVVKGAELTIARATQDYRNLHKSLSDHLQGFELQALETALQKLRSILLSMPRSNERSPSLLNQLDSTDRESL